MKKIRALSSQRMITSPPPRTLEKTLMRRVPEITLVWGMGSRLTRIMSSRTLFSTNLLMKRMKKRMLTQTLKRRRSKRLQKKRKSKSSLESSVTPSKTWWMNSLGGWAKATPTSTRPQGTFRKIRILDQRMEVQESNRAPLPMRRLKMTTK